jgi:hypothetical protein
MKAGHKGQGPPLGGMVGANGDPTSTEIFTKLLLVSGVLKMEIKSGKDCYLIKLQFPNQIHPILYGVVDSPEEAIKIQKYYIEETSLNAAVMIEKSNYLSF